MKQMKRIVSFLMIALIVLCAWFAWEASALEEDMVSSGLNLLYCVSLLISFFCLRIALSSTRKIRFIVIALSAITIILSTISWILPPELLTVGNIHLGILPLLIGSTLVLSVENQTKIARILQAVVGLFSIVFSAYVFLGVNNYTSYTVLFGGLLIVSVGTIGYLLFSATLKK
ncbi:MAG: hypothetical protein HWE22_19035 [Flavobacteriales bacterium]|nr:hypothetical protein [Flavobacteriales bacterium]